MKDVRKPLPSCTSDTAPLGKDPGGRLEELAVAWNGAADTCIKLNWYVSGSTSKRPKPPRTTVRPVLKGSHASPTRGAKFINVGFRNNGSPLWICAEPRVRRFASF